MDWKIPLFKIHADEDDVRSVETTIRRGMNWAIGPEVKEFENQIAEFIGSEYALVYSSGTCGLHAALLASGVGPGDEVIVPSFTFISTANSPLFVGARPVYAEIEERTLGLDPEDVKRRITEKTRAIMPVHYAGSPCMIRELKEIAEDHNIKLIEDAAESFGAAIGDTKVGRFGESAMFSFCANKIISTGEGGAVVTDSREIFEKLKLLRSHGRVENMDYFSSTQYMDYISLGYNMRMSSITAALGVSQMGKVGKIIDKRRKNAEYLNKHLSGIDGIIVPKVPEDYFHVYQMYTIRLTGKAGIRNALSEFLADKGIMTKVYFHPVHLTGFYREKFGFREGDLPITEMISDEVLTLPMYPDLEKDEMEYMAEKIEEFFA